MLRLVLCLLGAAALLYTFSYPDAILPPNPAAEDAGGVNLYSFKPIMWVIPVLIMELVSGMGKRRNLVWFTSLLTVLVGALIAYPLLSAYRPEYVEATFSYQGGMLSTGLVYFISFIGVSVTIRLLILAYMFPPEEFQGHVEVGYVSSSILDPENARTVREIAADYKPASHRFLFKAANPHLSTRFRLLMKRLVFRSRIITGGITAGILLVALWFALYPQPTPEEALQRDLKLMLEHKMNAQGIPMATRAAVHAAARVMKHVSDVEALAGMSMEEAEQWFHLDTTPATYRAWLRDPRPIKLPSVNSLHENRTRFLTVAHGRMVCVLYIRTNPADGSIVVSELQDAGWDAVADEKRRRIGTDWGALYR